MAQNQTIARPYAKALFELAFAEKQLPKWSEMLSLSAVIASDKQMSGLLKDPNFSTEQVVELFFALGKDDFSPEMKNLINTLAHFKRLAYLPEIHLLFDELKAQAEKTISVEVISAVPINADFQERFKEALRRRTQCDILLQCETDKSIIGGAIIRAGDLVIDGSVRGRLAILSDAVGIS